MLLQLQSPYVCVLYVYLCIYVCKYVRNILFLRNDCTKVFSKSGYCLFKKLAILCWRPSFGKTVTYNLKTSAFPFISLVENAFLAGLPQALKNQFKFNKSSVHFFTHFEMFKKIGHFHFADRVPSMTSIHALIAMKFYSFLKF